MGVLKFTGHGANVVGSLGSGSLVQDMPTACQFPSATYAQVVSGATTSWDYLDGAATCSWSIWFKSSDDDNGRLFDKFNGWTDGNVFYSRIDSGALQGVIATDATAVTSQVPSGSWFVADTWQNWMVTYDGANVKGYLNGVLKDTDALTGALESGGTDQEPLNIAAFRGSSQDWDGELRDFRIWTSGLTATEVAEVSTDVNMTGGTATSSLVGWWKMEEGTGTTLTDSSTETNNAIITGSTGWNKSAYNLNQIGSGSVSGSVTVSGGTWNLRDSTYMDLDASGDYILVSSNSDLDIANYTISSWFTTASVGADGWDTLICKKDQDTWQLYRNNDDIIFYNATDGNTTLLEGKISVNEWNQITITQEGTSMKTYLNGELITTNTVTASRFATAGNLLFGTKQGGADYWYGNMSEVRLYDAVLTSSQIDLLYKGQWDGAPVGWWKLNEGTGATATDSGTGGNDGAIAGATWVNPDYDIEGVLIVNSGTTTSAPRANFIMSAAGDTLTNYGTYTHNSGTVVFDHAADLSQKVNGPAFTGTTLVDPVLYNLTHNRPVDSYHMYTYGTVTVQNRFYNSGGYYNLRASGAAGTDATLILGTVTTSGTYESGWAGGGIRPAGTDTGKTVYVYGASQLYPAIISGSNAIDWDNEGPATEINIKWIDYVVDATTGGGGTTITLDGDCEFDAFTITLNDLFVLNGNKAEFAGGLDNQGRINLGGMIVCHADVDLLGYDYHSPTTAQIVMRNTSNKILTIGNNTYKDIAILGSNQVQFDGSSPRNLGATPIIAGAAASNDFGHNFNCGNLTIPVGSTLDGATDTITIGGDFNMAGGLIGRGSLDLDDASYEFVQVSGSTPLTDMLGTASYTWEMWVSSDEGATGYQGLLNLRGSWGNNTLGEAGAGDLKWSPELKLDGSDLGDATTNISIPSSIWAADTRWHHFAGVATSGTGVSLYWDGKLVAQNLFDWDEANWEGRMSDGYISIGKYNAGSGTPASAAWKYWDGKIGRTSFWKIALTESEIRSMMFQDWGTMAGADVIDDSKCVTWYEFNDRQNQTTITDMSGSGSTGTLMVGTATGVASDAASTGLWADHGTFTNNASTLTFSGSAGTTHKLNNKDNDTQNRVNNLTIAPNNYLDVWTSQSYSGLYVEGTLTMGSGSTIQKDSETTSTKMFFTGDSWDIDPAVSGGAGAGILDVSSFNDGTYFYGSTPSGAPLNAGVMFGVSSSTQGNDLTVSSYLQQYGAQTWDSNGYDITCPRFRSEGAGAAFLLNAGSVINVTNASDNYGFGDNVSGTTITASGEASAYFPSPASTDNYITVGDLNISNPDSFTVSLWVRRQSGYGYECPFGITSSYRILIDGNGKLLSQQPATVANFFSTNNIADNEWVHIAYVYDESLEKEYWYISGSQDSSKDNDNTGVAWDGTQYIGRYNSAGNYPMKNAVADIRVFRSALSAGNITTLASINPALRVSGALYADPANALVAEGWWQLGNTTSGTLDVANYGTSGATFNGTQYGAVKSGFVTVTGTAGFTMIPTGGTFTESLQNTYLSGSRDIIIPTDGTVLTKGTVVLD